MLSMVVQKKAIHAVPSAWVSWPPVGQRPAPVEHPDVVEAEESAGEEVACPSGSFRFTHQVKLSSSFWKARLRNAVSRRPRGPVFL